MHVHFGNANHCHIPETNDFYQRQFISSAILPVQTIKLEVDLPLKLLIASADISCITHQESRTGMASTINIATETPLTLTFSKTKQSV